MTKVLIVDDGNSIRASKTRMYSMFVQRQGASVTNEKLKNLTNLKDYDIILTDLSGKSVADNKAFLDLLEAACQAGAKPAVKMFSGGFTGASTDLPVPIPPTLLGIVATHNVMDATKVILASIAVLGGSQDKGPSPAFP